MVNYMNQVNLSGIDEIVNNNRVRAVAAQGTNAQGTMWMMGTGVPTSFASGSGAQNLSAAILGGGLIVHNLGANTNVTDTTDTAAQLLTYMNANSAGVNVGDILQVESITNAGTGTSVLTINPGSGITPDANGILTIAAGVQKTMNFRCTSTNPAAFTLYM